MKTINIILVSILCVLFFSCATHTATTKKMSDLEGVWNLQNEGKTTLGIGNNPVTLIYEPSSSDNISGFSGCNNYGGKIKGENGFIQFSNIYSTKMACPNLDLEGDYLDLLNQVDRFEIKRNDLYLYKGKLLLLHFKK